MVLKQQLDQKQVQKLILAPALQQAIKLLPLTNLELIEIIDQELSQNPVLEAVDETREEKDSSENSDLEKELSENPSDLLESKDDKIKDDEPDYEAYFQDYFDNAFRSYEVEKKETSFLENIISEKPSLWDHLNWQANLTFFEPKEKETAQFIIGNINEDGYLQASVKEIANAMKIKEEQVEAIREKIKRFDPVGTGSLNLKEALLTQMDYNQIKNKTTRRIINDYLQLLEKSDYSHLAKELGITLSKVKSNLEVIKKFDPNPGRKYSREKNDYIVPDIIVRKEDDDLKITLNDEGLPRLRISHFYKKMINKLSQDNADAYRFLKERMKKAFWFLRSLDQRNQTIYKVAEYIVKKQKDFIEKGLEYIKPLTLIELAHEIGVHESTVGRVVANKYIMTPRGVFPLKYFFHKSLPGDYGEGISSLRIKKRIQKLVENEDHKYPLSDIEIEEILTKENLRIARRTIAKYRKQLEIPPSHIRKRKYLMEEAK